MAMGGSLPHGEPCSCDSPSAWQSRVGLGGFRRPAVQEERGFKGWQSPSVPGPTSALQTTRAVPPWPPHRFHASLATGQRSGPSFSPLLWTGQHRKPPKVWLGSASSVRQISPNFISFLIFNQTGRERGKMDKVLPNTMIKLPFYPELEGTERSQRERRRLEVNRYLTAE